MQHMVTTLSVRVPIDIGNMGVLSTVASVLMEAQKELDKSDAAEVTLRQTVADDTPTVQTPAPRRRGPNRLKTAPIGNGQTNASTTVAVQPDTSKPGSEVTQPAWKVQAGNDPKAAQADGSGIPAFLDKAKQTKAA